MTEMNFYTANASLAGAEKLGVEEMQTIWRVEMAGELFYNLLAERIGNGHPTSALLQGDVGSGKTLVAAMALLGLAFNVKMLAALICGPALLGGWLLSNTLDWRRRLGWMSVAGLVLVAVWNSLLIVWIVWLASLRRRQNPRRDWPFLIPIGFGLIAVNWISPLAWGLALALHAAERPAAAGFAAGALDAEPEWYRTAGSFAEMAAN